MLGFDRFFAADNEQTLREFIAKNRPLGFIGPVQIDAAFFARLSMCDNPVWVEGVKEVTDAEEQRTITGFIGGW